MDTTQIIPIHSTSTETIQRLIANVIEEVCRSKDGELTTKFEEPIQETPEQLADYLRKCTIDPNENKGDLYKLVQLMEDVWSLLEAAQEINIEAFDVFELMDAIDEIHRKITGDELYFSLAGFFNLPQEHVTQFIDHEVLPNQKNLEQLRHGVILYCKVALYYIFNPLLDKNERKQDNNEEDAITDHMEQLHTSLMAAGHIHSREYNFNISTNDTITQPAAQSTVVNLFK